MEKFCKHSSAPIDSTHIAIAFGRFNPPTAGHGALFESVRRASRGGEWRIFASPTSGSSKNPLSFELKESYVRDMFPDESRNIVFDSSIRNLFEALNCVWKRGYKSITLVCGSDRIKEFNNRISRYNGESLSENMKFDFESWRVVSSGQRDEDSSRVDGISSTKMRKFVIEGNITEFAGGLPKSFGRVRCLFNDLRESLGCDPIESAREHVQMSTCDIRDKYVSGEIFNVGDICESTKTGKNFTITERKSNYVIDELDGKHFIKSIRPLTHENTRRN